eukprot:TRINITY_DN33087_c0_g1_i1.p1 TRINITY_DN33087_c0_g1~~TRINITY_DN33087_c0_g1_i1.p1  ORF type:complete len:355 (-),score=42.65 TRINITY_DN33087_c0_g1_i1:2-1066(-)
MDKSSAFRSVSFIALLAISCHVVGAHLISRDLSVHHARQTTATPESYLDSDATSQNADLNVYFVFDTSRPLVPTVAFARSLHSVQHEYPGQARFAVVTPGLEGPGNWSTCPTTGFVDWDGLMHCVNALPPFVPGSRQNELVSKLSTLKNHMAQASLQSPSMRNEVVIVGYIPHILRDAFQRVGDLENTTVRIMTCRYSKDTFAGSTYTPTNACAVSSYFMNNGHQCKVTGVNIIDGRTVSVSIDVSANGPLPWDAPLMGPQDASLRIGDDTTVYASSFDVKLTDGHRRIVGRVGFELAAPVADHGSLHFRYGSGFSEFLLVDFKTPVPTEQVCTVVQHAGQNNINAQVGRSPAI